MKVKTQEQIMKKWKVKNTEKPLVSIKCMAYNQEKYISQTINGFLNQKTSFPFEILIHDDCSTDNTTNIIKEYAEKYPLIIKPIFETENQYSKGDDSHHIKIDAAIKGKYLATCEGDDYWIYNKKLQSQVMFLEKNSEYGACYTRAKTYVQQTGKFGHKIGIRNWDFFNVMFYGNVIPNLTSVVRNDLLNEYNKEIQPEKKNWMVGDLPKWIWFSKNSKIHFSSRVTSVYRVLKNSASHFTNKEMKEKYENSVRDIRVFYAEKYSLPFFIERYDLYWNFRKSWEERNKDDLLKYGEQLTKKEKTIKDEARILIAKFNLIKFIGK